VTGLTPRYAFYQTLLNLRTFALSQVAWYWYGKWASAVNSFGKGTTIAAETTASYYNQIGTGSRSLFWNIFFSTPIGRKLFPEMFDDPTYNVINSQLLGNAQAFGVQAITDTSPR